MKIIWFREYSHLIRWENNPNGSQNKMMLTPSMFPFFSPQKIDALNGLQIKKVGCGDNFTVFLTSRGQVLASGARPFSGLTETQASVLRPVKVRE